MKRLLTAVLVTFVAAPCAVTASLAAGRCVSFKDGATATIAGVVVENGPNTGGANTVLVKVDHPCDAKFSEVTVIAGCKKGHHISATGKVTVGDGDYGEAAVLSPSSPPVCQAK